jgi:hypothetical protein
MHPTVTSQSLPQRPSNSAKQAEVATGPQKTEIVFSPIPGIVCVETVDVDAEQDRQTLVIPLVVSALCSLVVYLLYLFT